MVKARSKRRQEAIKEFRDTLYRMVDSPASDKYIRWSRCGEHFIMANTDQFNFHILPVYFPGLKPKTFHRYLNSHGFSKYRAHR